MPKAVPIENNHQISVIATSVLGIVLATTFVALRLIAKRMGSGFDYSDYCVLAALVFNTAIHVDSILMVVYGGFGLHLNDIYFRFGPDTAMFFFKGVFAYPILWNIIVCFSKLSILFMYLTLIPNRSMLLWVRGLSAFFILWAIGNILGAFLLCRPLSKNWDFTPPRKCGSIIDYYSSMSIINIVTDVILIILPMPYLYKLRLALHKKIIAMAMLSIGIGTWVISIYRQTILKDLNVLDFTYSGVLVTLLSALEPSVALALACVPLLRPLARSRRLKGTASSQYGSSGGSQTLSRVGGKRADGRHFDQLNDDSSEVELQPVDRIRDNRFRSPSAGKHKQTITVEKRIEITSDVEH